MARLRLPTQTELKAIPQGPWGGEGGCSFYDGRGDIVEIEVSYDDDHVQRLQVTYAESTGVRWQSETHGSDCGTPQKISLNYPEEYLKQVVVTSDQYLNSICFVTNQNTFGPFGNTGGETYESPADGVVVGFFGRSGAIIDQLGVLTTGGCADPVQVGKPARGAVIAQGQWGGPGGWSFGDGRGDIVEVTVKYNCECVTMLRAVYEHSGVRFEGPCHGEGLDGEECKVVLDFPSERLLQVEGTYDKFVNSITFFTSKQAYGPFGTPRGVHFLSLPNGVVGFLGKSGSVIDSLGVLTHVENPWGPTFGRQPQLLASGAVAEGPWGGFGGRDFYDGTGDVVELEVFYNKYFVSMLQVTYELGDTRFGGAPHGTSDDGKHFGLDGFDLFAQIISLDFPEEHLVQVRGTYGRVPGKESACVTSLTFVTNKQSYGPFGVASGYVFESAATGVVGFFGKSGARLDQLGVFSKVAHPKQNLRGGGVDTAIPSPF